MAASDVVMIVVGLGLIGILGWYLWRDNQRSREYQEVRRAQNKIMAQLLEDADEVKRDLDRLTWQEKPQPAALTDPMFTEMLTRLLDAALPKREEVAVDDGAPGSPAEYEPPDAQVNDWTDPFFGLERETVGGLRPGQPIPGIGEPRLEESADHDLATWEAEGITVSPDGTVSSVADHPLANGYVPDDDAPREGWADRGGELFEDWDARG